MSHRHIDQIIQTARRLRRQARDALRRATKRSPFEQVIIDVSVFLNAMSTMPRKQALRTECIEFLRRVHSAQKKGQIELRDPIFVLEVFSAFNREWRDHLRISD